MRIAVIGAGYVGLVTGVGFAHLGHEVTLVDIHPQKIAMINRGQAPIYEPGLEPLLRDSIGRNLEAVLDTKEAVNNAEAIFLCVQTAPSHNGAMDVIYVDQAARDVGKAIRETTNYPIIVVKSTVIPGTTERLVVPRVEEYSGKKAGPDFGIAVNPEFLRQGEAIADFLKPDRIIIGELDKTSGDILCRLYHGFDAPILRVNMTVAEMTKYASNAFLATKVSFINEIGNICKRLGIDVDKVAEGMGLDCRISPHFLRAGIGFGGSCLPKDTEALIVAAEELGYQPSLLRSVAMVNKQQPLRLVELAERRLGSLSGRTVAVLGLSFKPGTDDVRAAPSIKIVGQLLKKGAIVKAYDPVAEDNARAIFNDSITYAATAAEAVSSADVVFVLTEWEEFKEPALYEGKKVFDGRRVLHPHEAETLDYEGICW